ncbi:hypothetical protein ACRTAQ_003027 [Clostridium perfringens]
MFSLLNSVWVPKGVERFNKDKDDSDFSSYMCAYDQNLGKEFSLLNKKKSIKLYSFLIET